ncbi:MAG: RDD family protein [Actinomycetota bacterium]
MAGTQSGPLGQEGIVTPEAVALRLDVAGLGTRMIAALIDMLIQTGVLAVTGLLFLGAGSAPGMPGRVLFVAYLVLAFVILWGYFPIFEGLWRGRTPGKRSQGLRVVGLDGQPATLGAVLVRNLVRLVDFLPAFYSVGFVTVLANRRSQRLGDIAAGTLVVRERRLPAPRPLASAGHEPADDIGLDASALTPRDYEMVRSFLDRREGLAPSARDEVARTLASALRSRVSDGGNHSTHPEVFLELVARAYRRRFGSTS